MVECSSSSDATGGSDHRSQRSCPPAWGLMDYLTERGMVLAASGTDADGTCLVTYHPTDSGFRLLERILELLNLLEEPARGSEGVGLATEQQVPADSQH